MALINRVTRLFKADFHAVLDQIEEPELVLKQAIREMEDDLAVTEQRINLSAHDQQALVVRSSELESTIADFDDQLDLCFSAGKDNLAKALIKRRLEAQYLLKRLNSKHMANEKYLHDQQTMLGENKATLEALHQKAEFFSRTSACHDGASEFDDIAWMAREMTVSDEEVEIAFLHEQHQREEYQRGGS